MDEHDDHIPACVSRAYNVEHNALSVIHTPACENFSQPGVCITDKLPAALSWQVDLVDLPVYYSMSRMKKAVIPAKAVAVLKWDIVLRTFIYSVFSLEINISNQMGFFFVYIWILTETNQVQQFLFVIWVLSSTIQAHLMPGTQ